MTTTCPRSSSSSSSFSPTTLHQNLATHGYAILPARIPRPQLASLLAAARALAAAARAGRWPHLRTLPKQFPPWGATPDSGIWGVQHLLHPELPVGVEARRALQEVYFGEGVVGVVREVLVGADADDDARAEVVMNGDGYEAWDGGGEQRQREGGDGKKNGDDMLVMELFNMLVTPDRDFALRWHRDDVSFELGLEEEAAALGLASCNGRADAHAHAHAVLAHTAARTTKKRRAFHAQYNVPLLADASLHVIPGSHLRARTPHEAELLAADPYTDALPGWIEVRLEPGDVVFYDNNLIHRGVYRAGTDRLTLHGSVGDVRAGRKRARNVLQHGCEWVPRCDFTELKDERVRQRAEGMRDRLVALGNREGDVGFAHDD